MNLRTLRRVFIAAAFTVPLLADGTLTTILTPNYSYQAGNYGLAYDAFTNAGHLALAADGTLYFQDGLYVRKITPAGQALPVAGYAAGAPDLPMGERSPAILGSYAGIHGFAVDGQGNVFIAGFLSYNGIYRVGPDGIMQLYATPATGTWYTYALSSDPAGNVYALVAPYENYGSQVVKIALDGTSVAVAGTGTNGHTGDGGPATAAQINAIDIAVDANGDIFLAGIDNVIREVNAQGTITAVGQGTAPITVDSGGNLYYFLPGGSLNRMTPGGAVSAIATVPDAAGVAVDSSGKIFVAAGGVYALSGSGEMQLIAGCACFGNNAPATWAVVSNPTGLVQDSAGNLYMSDAGNNTVRRIGLDGSITLVAGTGQAGWSGDGGPATQALLSAPSGLALDNAGNLYIAERGNSVIRRVSPSGVIQTVAGNGTAGFSGDGGSATAARIALPDGVAVDSAGNIYIADTANHRIRKVTSDGTIQTIAGSGTYGTTGDGGPASQALMINPRALVFDHHGNLLFTDSSAHMVRMITPAGIVQRVSGTGTPGYAGDGGPAASAQDWAPWGLAVDAAGDIFIGDTGTYSVRMVNPAGIIEEVAQSLATGLAADFNGNLWIAGGSLSVFSQGSTPIPLAPVIAKPGIANLETGQTQAIAPGEMVSISGNYLGPAIGVSAPGAGSVLPTELGGVQVFFDNVAAPLLQVGAQQIVAVVPFEVAGKSTVGITVQYGSMSSNTATIGVLPALPGVFNQYGQALALNTPAAPGSIISVFVTGAGVMSPPQSDGAIGGSQTSVPALPVSASMGSYPQSSTPVAWTPLQVTYAGSADWLIAGTIQVNVQMPNPLPQSTYPVFPLMVRVGDSVVQVSVSGQ